MFLSENILRNGFFMEPILKSNYRKQDGDPLISQNVPGQVLQQADGEVLAIDKQEIETQVEVKSGETLALGHDRRRIFKQSMVRRNMKFSCMDIMYQEISLTLFIVDVVIMDLQRLLLFHI